MTDKLMTVKNVAAYLSIHPMTVYKLAKAGEIPAFKIGGQWRFRKKALDNWVIRQIKKNERKKDS